MSNQKFKRQELIKNLIFTLHPAEGSPIAFRLDMRAASLAVLLLSTLLLISLSLSLLFFREVEINRKLEERVLHLEIIEKLALIGALPAAITEKPFSKEEASIRIPASQSDRIPFLSAMNAGHNKSHGLGSITTKAFETRPSILAREPGETGTIPQQAELSKQPQQKVFSKQQVSVIEALPVMPRVGMLNASCTGEKCSINLSLVPTGQGMVQGSLLVILESEIPKIGTANASSSIRKRYFIYPEGSSLPDGSLDGTSQDNNSNSFKDELSQNDISTLATKQFRFARGLQSTVDFTIGALLRPLAVHVYLFDSGHNMVQHERKEIGVID